MRETLANYCWWHYCSVSLTFIISIFMSDYAKGLEGVIANESALSNVEGLDGRLSYLGYSIDELVGNCSFEETTYLLHFGKLPNTSELAEFEKSLRTNREIPQGVIDFLKSAPKDANPMDDELIFLIYRHFFYLYNFPYLKLHSIFTKSFCKNLNSTVILVDTSIKINLRYFLFLCFFC